MRLSSVVQPYPTEYALFGGTIWGYDAYPQMPLTDAKIRNLKTKATDYKVSDFEGLFVLVKKTGSKSWRFKYRVAGKES